MNLFQNSGFERIYQSRNAMTGRQVIFPARIGILDRFQHDGPADHRLLSGRPYRGFHVKE
jgi:hypothetical protein